MADWRNRNELEALLAEGLTIREIAAEAGCSYTTVRYWLKRHGLETAAQAFRSAKRAGPLPKHAVRRCATHGETEFVLEGRGYYRCKRCRAKQVAKRRRRVKEILVVEAGGECRLCGYSRYQGALEFHHLDPAEKGSALRRYPLAPDPP